MAIQTVVGASEAVPNHPSSVPALSLAALGVVFGDIGTSPLYTLKTVLEVTGGAQPKPGAILGSLSLILWTLIIVTSLKYVSIALRFDNGGEGGILALMALLRRLRGRAAIPHHVCWSVRRGAGLWRCCDNAGNFSHVGTGGDEHRSTSPRALRPASSRNDSGRAVRSAAARY